jgi:hypothetical protein
MLLLFLVRCLPSAQGLPVGHTAPCYPVHTPGIRQHRGPALRDSEADTQARARFALLGNAVTVQVGGCSRGQCRVASGRLREGPTGWMLPRELEDCRSFLL